MKKVLAILLAIAMIAAMAACAQKAAPADETKTSGETTSTAGETVDNTADDTAALQISNESNAPTQNFWRALQQTSDYYSFEAIISKPLWNLFSQFPMKKQ